MGPQFPIEMIESKLQQAKKEDEARKSGDEVLDMDIPDEVIIPHYQRVTANGERDDSSGVPIEDLKSLSEMLVKAMEIRERYMGASHQKFPSYVKRFLGSKDGRVETLSPGDSVVKRKAPTVAGSAKPSFITRLLLSFGFILNSTLIYNAVYKSFIYLVHGGIHPCDPCDQKKKIFTQLSLE